MPPEPVTGRPPCRRCDGSGMVETTATASRRPVRVACPECAGAGETGPLPASDPGCDRCGGAGVVLVGMFRDKPVTIGCPQCSP
jgi:DnaJ-class molecular chaperone